MPRPFLAELLSVMANYFVVGSSLPARPRLLLMVD